MKKSLEIIKELKKYCEQIGYREKVLVRKDYFFPILKRYAKRSFGLNLFCKHWRVFFRDGSCLHFEDCDSTKYYYVHLDRYDPHRYPIHHLIFDAPHLLVIGGILYMILKKASV